MNWGMAAGPGILLLALALPIGTARGQHYHVPVPSPELFTLSDRISRLEAELAALRHDGLCEPCSVPVAQACRSGSWFAGAEVALLKPYHSMGIRGANGTDLSFNLQPTPRLWLGYTDADGLGIRARYWQFDQWTRGPSIVTGRTDGVGFDTYVLDGELTSAASFGCYSATLSAGVRYVDHKEERASTDDITGAVTRLHQFSFTGLGPTTSVALQRPWIGNLSLIGQVRMSGVVGDETEILSTAPTDVETDNMRLMVENQLGFRWDQLRAGTRIFAKAAYELQYWHNFSGEERFDGGESIGFSGVTFGVGLTR